MILAMQQLIHLQQQYQYSQTNGQFVYISGTQEAKDHPSQALAGGSTYYLHLGYRKDGSVDTGDDQIVIHSIKVYQAKDVTYTFVNNNWSI